MKRLFIFFALFLTFLLNVNLLSQTYPNPFDLSSGNYSLTEWASTNTAGTYPPNMIFHRASVQDPTLSAEMTTNYTSAYNLTSGTRINGLGADGFSFLNTGTNGNLGAAVLAINTTNRTNIVVSFVAGFVKILGTTSREYRVVLQYKVGDGGTFRNVTDEFGNPVAYTYNEYVNHPNPTTLPPHSQSFSVRLPNDAEDQPVVYLRWKYYFLGTGSGNRPELRVDDILVQSESSLGGGTRLNVSNITPASPLSNIPFSVSIACTDDNGIAKKVSQNTTVRVSLVSGSGTLTGTLAKQILYKTTTVVFDDLSYNRTETIRLRFEVISGDALSPVEVDVDFAQGPARIEIQDLYSKGHVSVTHPPFKVVALNSDGSINNLYTNYTATIYFGGPSNFYLTANFVNGVANVQNVSFSAAGTFQVYASSPGFASSNTASVEIKPLPVMTEIHVPKVLKGVGNFGTRVPTYALVRLDNLHPNTVYRFFTGGRHQGYTGNPATDNGAGNNFHYNHITETYAYSSNRSLTADNGHSTFKTDENQTTKYIWLNLVPTTNASFNEGQRVYWILVLGNELGTLISRYTTTNTSLAMDFGNSPNKLTGIYDIQSQLPEKAFICLFEDKNDTNPVSIAIVQNDGAILQEGVDSQGNPFPPQGPDYYNNLDNQSTSWATVIPNNLSKGIQKIVVYDANGNVIKSIYDNDAIWAGVNTKEVYGGATSPIEFRTPFLRLIDPVENFNASICNDGSYEVRWVARGVEKVDLELSADSGKSYISLVESIPAQKGFVEWRMPREIYSERPVQLRIIDYEHPTNADETEYVQSLTDNFVIYDAPIITKHTKSALLCKNESVRLEAYGLGSLLSYQWYKDGKPIEGATSQVLEINNANYEASGVYTCEVGGASVCPSVFTKEILVYVNTSTSISRQPVDFYGELGSTAEFSFDVHALGLDENFEIYLQWYRNGNILVDNNRVSGSRSNFLSIKNITFEDTNDVYFAVVRGKCGIDTTVRVRIRTFPKISLGSDTLYVCDDKQELTIPVTIPELILDSKPVIDLYKDNMRVRSFDHGVTGVINVRLTPIGNTTIGNYWLEIRIPGQRNIIRSGIVKVIKISEPPTITKDLPSELTLKEGEDLVLEIGANGPNLSYQWYKDDMPIPRANESSFTISGVTTDDAGEYYCLVWNCDTVKSNTAKVNITLFAISGVAESEVNNSRVQIFPNPANSELFIDVNLSDAAIGEISMADYFGNSVALLPQIQFTKGMNRIKLNLEQFYLASGTYLFVLKVGNQQHILPVVILK